MEKLSQFRIFVLYLFQYLNRLFRGAWPSAPPATDLIHSLAKANMSSSSSSSSSSSRLSLSPAIEAEVQARVAAEVQVRMSAMEPEIQLRVNRATAAAISQIMAGLYTGRCT